MADIRVDTFSDFELVRMTLQMSFFNEFLNRDIQTQNILAGSLIFWSHLSIIWEQEKSISVKNHFLGSLRLNAMTIH